MDRSRVAGHTSPMRVRGRAIASLAVVLAMLGFAWFVAPGAGASRAGSTPPGLGKPTDVSDPTAIELSELVTLGLVLMERRPDALGGPPPPPPSDLPWTDAYRTGPNPDSPLVVPPPALGPGDATIYAIGDSVLLGTSPYLQSAVGGWDLRLDGEVSRTFPGGLRVLYDNAASVGQVMVVVLGHNYGGGGRAAGYIEDVMAVARRSQRVVFVTVTEWSPAQAEVNRAIYAAAQRWPNIVVAPWAETVAANPQFLWDHVHPNTSGAVALANLIATMIGPAPEIDGQKPPPPNIRPIPVDPTPAPTTTGPTIPAPTSTTLPPTTTTTAPSTTTTAPPPTSTSTTAPPPAEPP